MKNCLLFAVIFLAYIPNVTCQVAADTAAKRERVSLTLQLGYNIGIAKIRLTDNLSVPNNGYMVRARATGGFFIHPKTSLGVSLGLDGYHKPDFNLLPIAVNFRYYMKPYQKSIFLDANAGYCLKLSESFKKGAAADLSFGYRLSAGKKTNLLISTGINFQHIENAETFVYDVSTGSFTYVTSSYWLSSVAFTLGFLF